MQPNIHLSPGKTNRCAVYDWHSVDRHTALARDEQAEEAASNNEYVGSLGDQAACFMFEGIDERLPRRHVASECALEVLDPRLHRADADNARAEPVPFQLLEVDDRERGVDRDEPPCDVRGARPTVARTRRSR